MLLAYLTQTIDYLYIYWIDIKGKYTGLRQHRRTKIDCLSRLARTI